MAAYPTPHINATPDDFAPTVLMPGDPLRSKFVAENFLTDARLVNNVRGVQGYTGLYKGKPVSVMASGMGIPSIGIYSYELFNFFGVENIIRIGSAGSLQDHIHLRDVVIAEGACTNSNYCSQFDLRGTYAPIADFGLLKKADAIAEELGVRHFVGNVFSSDTFYSADKLQNDNWRGMGALCVEMETAALYVNAARAHKHALGIFTISDHIYLNEVTSAEERQSTFTQMMEIALEVAVR